MPLKAIRKAGIITRGRNSAYTSSKECGDSTAAYKPVVRKEKSGVTLERDNIHVNTNRWGKKRGKKKTSWRKRFGNLNCRGDRISLL